MRIGILGHTLAKHYLNIKTRNRTVFLKGASGIGKTQVVYQVGEILSQNLEDWDGIRDIRLSQFDPVDFRGIPVVVTLSDSEKRTAWVPPEFFPKPGTSGIIFLDEITSAPPAVQAVAYQLCCERRVGEYELPDGWMIIAAGNRQSDRGVTFNIAAPLINRMTELNVDTTFEDWQEYAGKCGKRPETLAFLKSRQDLLHKFEGKGVIEQFPSPRGWFAVSDIMDADFTTDVRVELIKGTVGNEAAVAFESYLRIYERIPDLDRIKEDPENVEVPDDMDLRYCLSMGISARMDVDNFAPYWKYLRRMPKEYQTLTVKLAYRRDKELSKCSAFGEWAAANIDAFKRV
jgi:hypothetical protein